MNENDFYTNTEAHGKRDFLKRIGVLFVIAIILTGFLSLGYLFGIIVEIQGQVWKGEGVAFLAKEVLITATMFILFGSLIKIAIDDKPFSKTLTWSIRLNGMLFIAASVIIPRLSGYQTSGFEIFSYGRFVLIDGAMFLPGLLLTILGNIIMAGFDMQKEMDEIL